MKLLATLLFLLMSSLSAEIMEIELLIEGIDCPYCFRSVEKTLKTIPGIKNINVSRKEEMARCHWDESIPFCSGFIFNTFSTTQFIIKKVTVDIEATFEKKRGAKILISKPDNSTFYIDNVESTLITCLQPGDVIQAKGAVVNKQGFNFITIDHLTKIPDEVSKGL